MHGRGARTISGRDGRKAPGGVPDRDPVSETPQATMTDSGSGQGTILVADDNEDCRMALSALLEAEGYTVYEADDGESAVAVAERRVPDLILMDLMMPGVDGLEATRRIRSADGLEDVRIVAVTAMEGAREASLDAGCDDCILKPVDLKSLGERVDGWMGGS